MQFKFNLLYLYREWWRYSHWEYLPYLLTIKTHRHEKERQMAPHYRSADCDSYCCRQFLDRNGNAVESGHKHECFYHGEAETRLVHWSSNGLSIKQSDRTIPGRYTLRFSNTKLSKECILHNLKHSFYETFIICIIDMHLLSDHAGTRQLRQSKCRNSRLCTFRQSVGFSLHRASFRICTSLSY